MYPEHFSHQMFDDLDPELNIIPSLNNLIYSYDDLPLESTLKTHLSFFHSNVRSLPKNNDELLNCLSLTDIHFSAIALTETWLTIDNKDLYDFPDYNSIHTTRTDRRGGGVSLYIDSKLDFKRRQDLDILDRNTESLFIEIPTTRELKPMIIGVIYRPPNSDLHSFNVYLSRILSQISRENKISYLLGDFNIDISEYRNDSLTSEFLDLMHSESHIPLINSTTRQDVRRSSIIDNIFTNNISFKHTTGIIHSDISDHYPIFCSFDPPKNPCLEDVVTFRRYSQNNNVKFSDFLSNESWQGITTLTDPCEAYEKFINIIQNYYESSFPIITRKRTKRDGNKWITEGLKISIKHKNKLYIKYKNRPTLANKIIYNRYKNMVRDLISRAKRDYYQRTH